MLSRYAVVVASTGLWAVLTAPHWVTDPLARDTLFGAPGTVHLLVLGVVGFVVLGTLYHVVPFIVWDQRYSDLLGYEAVPMVDDLYSDRIAAVDFALLGGGTATLVASDLLPLPSTTAAVGGVSVLVGSLLFLANVAKVVREHSPRSLPEVLFGRVRTDRESSSDESTEPADG